MGGMIGRAGELLELCEEYAGEQNLWRSIVSWFSDDDILDFLRDYADTHDFDKEFEAIENREDW